MTREPSWPNAADAVETLALRPGVTLVLSGIGPGEACAFHHVETEDVFAIGFHLTGGAQFDMEGARVDTLPLEVHASATPRGATSRFVLPDRGFRTVALRFAPEAAEDLFRRHGGPDLLALAGASRHRVATGRLSALDPAGSATVEAMFAAPHDAARSLFLESCALRLLAAQIGAAARSSEPAPARGLLAARDHLDQHLASPPSIIELARTAGINDFKLKRAFKEAFGTTIYGYVRQRRMERAAADLHAGLSVAQAAAKASYECPRCFADAFRRHYGVLPSEVTRGVLAETPARHG